MSEEPKPKNGVERAAMRLYKKLEANGGLEPIYQGKPSRQVQRAMEREAFKRLPRKA